MGIHAPIGQMLTDGERVRCHLCGQWFLSVASHIRVHGWSKADYIAEFGLELGNPLSGPLTRKRRSAALLARRIEPAIRHAQQRALTRSRSGALAMAAAEAARGRRTRPNAARRPWPHSAASTHRPARRAAAGGHDSTASG
ncbi:hypothetical protein OHA72_01565 [Dactylosporangium sp. NBC_01737]|uniref:hypothetical protein n=1 Tax=Dactylosporangium sp. NBC_01737 TaxID=2975959 RepID=UPI002E0EAE31|nr:hypothetical protein OHA72_01565 [Dactylosporangium sp. NBC_01737]